jgi:hypothetical protein
MLLIGHKLLMHAAMVFQMLPTDFTKQEAVKQAEVLGVSVKTIEVWLQKYIQSSHIERVMHGSYRKAICKTA